jgi:hypothetical protein
VESPQHAYFAADHSYWQQIVADHPDIGSVESVEAFFKRNSALLPIRREELVSIKGKSLIDPAPNRQRSRITTGATSPETDGGQIGDRFPNGSVAASFPATTAAVNRPAK